MSFLPTPTIQSIIKKINPVLTIYYCADDMARYSQAPEKLRMVENKFFKSSDLVFTTSHKLYERASRLSNNVFNLPAGVDYNKFHSAFENPSMPKDMQTVKGRVIGYIGAITKVLNFDIIKKLATEFCDATIVFVGPVYIDISNFQEFNNIIFLGEKKHNLIPNYVNCFDVALIPYVVNKFTDSVYSCKLNEYLSMGKVVVSTNLLEVRIFNKENDGVVLIGKDIDGFISNVRRAFYDDKTQCDKRIEIARKNSWNVRFDEIATIINRYLPSAFSGFSSWKSKMILFYKKSHRKLVLRLTFIIVLYLLIFYSPIFGILGEGLIIRDDIKQSDAIVVFSGDGEVDYQNLSYQKRAIDAINIYKSGHASKIYLSSGREQTISDAKIITLFLIDKGVQGENIKVLSAYPNSTYQNVKLVKKMLDEDRVNSIIFITSPYHSLRANLLWKKQAPNIEVINPEVVDTPKNRLLYSIKFENIRVILYEYLSIVYNYLLGRI